MAGTSAGGGAGRGAAQPATMPRIAAPHAAAKAVRYEATHPMALLLLESLLALALAVLIVWWVALAGRRPDNRDDRDP
jgi:small neutral amino acid transporter SnatA (MarC family)